MHRRDFLTAAAAASLVPSLVANRALAASLFSGAASQKLQQEALSTGPSDWAKNALAKQQFEEGQAAGSAGLQQQSAQSGAESNLMRLGGLSGGARTSLARSGAKDLLNAKQGVAGQ